MPFSDSKPSGDSNASQTPSVSYSSFSGAADVRKQTDKERVVVGDSHTSAPSKERDVKPGN